MLRNSNTGERRLALRLAILLVLALAALAAGCGSSDDDAGSGSDGGSTTAATAPASDAALQQEVEQLLGPRGTNQPPPSRGPAPRSGVDLTIVTCGQYCVEDEAAADAARQLGWNVSLFDYRGDPTRADAGIRGAIASKSDAVLLLYVDCAYVRGALEEAKDAGLPVIAVQSFDCSDSAPLFTSSVEYVPGSYEQFNHEVGVVQAKYALARDADAKALLFAENTSSASRVIADGWRATFDACEGDCELTLDSFPFTQMGAGFQAEAEQELLKNPDTSVVAGSYSSVALAVAPALRAGNADLPFAIGESIVTSADLVRSREADTFGIVADPVWAGWAGIDTVNRTLAGDPAANSGIGLQLYDKDHNVPARGPITAPIDFKRYYREAWGL